MQSSVILVDRHDNPTGTTAKINAHLQPLLHRAFSVLVFDSRQRLLLQKRANDKYHSAGLWSNTCCSHPGADDLIGPTAETRLREEMGFTTELEKIGTLHYELELSGGLFEYEFNHVFCGTSDRTPQPNSTEVSDWQALPLLEITTQLQAHPERFTAWFPLILERLAGPIQHYLNRKNSRHQ